MKTKPSKSIAEYKFEDNKQGIKALIAIHFILFALFLLPDPTTGYGNAHTQFCLVTGTAVLVLNQVYDWRSNYWNTLILSTYLLSVAIELLLFGFPERLYTGGSAEVVSKGIFLELIILFLPYIYVGIRICFALPLLMIIGGYAQLKHSES
ncbi:MAG: hypothetical protein KDC44_15090 [Phaeodactylibacter sp.]|nr:hypothetical protein [Phaeodactylibacter sp.]